MKKILITGALGQNGQILSKIYIKKKFKVFGFVKRLNKNKIRGVKYYTNNLKNKITIEHHIKKISPDIIIHLASTNNSYVDRRKKDNYKINYSDNFLITKNLIDTLVKLKIKTLFIFAGSSIMYENSKRKIITEKDKFNSNEYYGKYKIDSFKYILANTSNILKTITLILFNHDSKYRNKKFLVPKLINAFKQKNIKYIQKIYYENISGDFSHAEDICNGIFKLSITNSNIEKIILSTGKRFYINKLIIYLEKRFKLKIDKKLKFFSNKNFKFIGSNNYAQKKINYKNKKNLIDVCKDILKN